MASTRNVLELRVHGVSNTPPQDMLEIKPGSIVERGDSLGGFWSLTPDAMAAQAPSDRGWVPDDITREAYSWGGMARTTPPGVGLGFVASAVALGARLGWIGLMPFGLANAAFWSRLPAPTKPGAEPDRFPAGRRTMRLFALVLTLLFTMTLYEILVDLVAVQCLAAADTCRGLPTTLDVARSWQEGPRAAAAVVLVLLGVAALAWLSIATNVRYESMSPPDRDGTTRRTAADAPLLADRKFWSRPSSKRHLLTIHVVAAISVVVLTTAVDRNVRAAFHVPDEPLTPMDSWVRMLWLLAGGLALATACYVLWYLLTTRQSSISKPSGELDETRRPSRWVTFASLASLLLCLGALVAFTPRVTQPSTLQPSVMSTPGPALLAIVTAGVFLVGLAWGFRTIAAPGRGHVWLAAAALVAFVGVIAVGCTWGSSWAWRSGLALTLAMAVAHRVVAGGARPEYGFRGRAAATFMLLSLGFAVLLSSAATLAVGDWLNDCYSAADLTPEATSVGCVVQSGSGSLPSQAADLTAPAVFQMAAALIIPCFGAGLLLLLVVVVKNFAGDRPAAPLLPYSVDSDPDLLDASRQAARRFASITARAEPALCVVAWVVLANLVIAIPLAAAAESGKGDRGPSLTWFIGAGVASTAFLVLIVVGTLIGGTTTGGKRPLGLVWDLLCFLPRDGHPLAPPCYAERAIPELTGRVLGWLDADDIADPHERNAVAPERRVILSGHSLGGVLCVATILQLAPGRCGRVSLMTYGCQLQAYFARVFPMLLGPAVLGIPATPVVHLWPRTPWPSEPVSQEWGADTVRVRLGGASSPAGAGVDDRPRWRNLWRATDPIGFPVDTGRWATDPSGLGPIDYGCDEIDPTGYMPRVAGHSDYPRSPEYSRALRSLRDGMPMESVGAPSVASASEVIELTGARVEPGATT